MYVTGDTIIRFATVLGALGTLGALLYRSFHWMEQQKAQQAEIENIKKEQCVICYGLLATLDGLKQLGANGNVSDAYQRLEKSLNRKALFMNWLVNMKIVSVTNIIMVKNGFGKFNIWVVLLVRLWD